MAKKKNPNNSNDQPTSEIIIPETSGEFLLQVEGLEAEKQALLAEMKKKIEMEKEWTKDAKDVAKEALEKLEKQMQQLKEAKNLGEYWEGGAASLDEIKDSLTTLTTVYQSLEQEYILANEKLEEILKTENLQKSEPIVEPTPIVKPVDTIAKPAITTVDTTIAQTTDVVDIKNVDLKVDEVDPKKNRKQDRAVEKLYTDYNTFDIAVEKEGLYADFQKRLKQLLYFLDPLRQKVDDKKDAGEDIKKAKEDLANLKKEFTKIKKSKAKKTDEPPAVIVDVQPISTPDAPVAVTNTEPTAVVVNTDQAPSTSDVATTTSDSDIPTATVDSATPSEPNPIDSKTAPDAPAVADAVKPKEKKKEKINGAEKQRMYKMIFNSVVSYWLNQGEVSGNGSKKSNVDKMYEHFKSQEKIINEKIKSEIGIKYTINDILPFKEDKRKLVEKAERVLSDVPLAIAVEVQDRVERGEELEKVLADEMKLLSPEYEDFKDHIIRGIRKRVVIKKATATKQAPASATPDKLQNDPELNRKIIELVGPYKELSKKAFEIQYSSDEFLDLGKLVKELNKLTDPDKAYKFIFDNKLSKRLEEETVKINEAEKMKKALEPAVVEPAEPKPAEPKPEPKASVEPKTVESVAKVDSDETKEKKAEKDWQQKKNNLLDSYSKAVEQAKKNGYESDDWKLIEEKIKKLQKLENKNEVEKFFIDNPEIRKDFGRIWDQIRKYKKSVKTPDKKIAPEQAKKPLAKPEAKPEPTPNTPVAPQEVKSNTDQVYDEAMASVEKISQTVDASSETMRQASEAIDATLNKAEESEKQQIHEIKRRHDKENKKAKEIRKRDKKNPLAQRMTKLTTLIKKYEDRKYNGTFAEWVEDVKEEQNALYPLLDEELKRLEENPVATAPEKKKKPEVVLSTADFFDILKTKEKEMEDALRVILENITEEGKEPNRLSVEAVRHIFDGEPDEKTVFKLRAKGIDNWKDFQKMWQNEKSKEVAKVLNVWLNQQFKEEMLKQSDWVDKLIVGLSKVNAIKGEVAKRIFITGLTVGGGALVASTVLATGGLAGVAVAAGGGAAGGLVRGLLNKFWFGGKEKQEAMAKKSMEAGANKLKKIWEKNKEVIDEKVLQKIFSDGAFSVNKFSAILAEAFSEAELNKQAEVKAGEGKVLGREAKQKYYEALRRLKNEGKIEPEEQDKMDLALLLYDLQEKDKQILEKQLKESDPTVVKALDGLMKAYGGRSEKGGLLASTLVGGVVGSALFSTNGEARALIGGVAGGLAGYRLGESKMEKEVADRLLAELENKILPETKKDYLTFLIEKDWVLGDKVLKQVKEFKTLLAGGGVVELARALKNNPLVRAEIKSFVSEVENNPEFMVQDEYQNFYLALKDIKKKNEDLEYNLETTEKAKRTWLEKIKVGTAGVLGVGIGAGLAWAFGKGVQEVRQMMGFGKAMDFSELMDEKEANDIRAEMTKVDNQEDLPPLADIIKAEETFTVQQREGISYALRDEIESDPEKYGYDPKNDGNIHKWATQKSIALCKEAGVIRVDGSELRADKGVELKVDMYQTQDGEWHLRPLDEDVHAISAEEARKAIRIAQAREAGGVKGGPAREITEAEYNSLKSIQETPSGHSRPNVIDPFADETRPGIRPNVIDPFAETAMTGKGTTITGEPIHEVVADTLKQAKQSMEKFPAQLTGQEELVENARGASAGSKIGETVPEDLLHPNTADKLTEGGEEELGKAEKIARGLGKEEPLSVAEELSVRITDENWGEHIGDLHKMIENTGWSQGEKSTMERIIVLLKLQDEIFGKNGEELEGMVKSIEDFDSTDEDDLVFLKEQKQALFGAKEKGIDVLLNGLKKGDNFRSIEESLSKLNIEDYGGAVRENKLPPLSAYDSDAVAWAKYRQDYKDALISKISEDL